MTKNPLDGIVKPEYLLTPTADPTCIRSEYMLINSLFYHLNIKTKPDLVDTPYGTALIKSPFGLSTHFVVQSNDARYPGLILTQSKNPRRIIFQSCLGNNELIRETQEKLDKINLGVNLKSKNGIVLSILGLMDLLKISHDPSLLTNVKLYSEWLESSGLKL